MSDGIKPLDWLRDAIDDDRLTTTERAAVAAITRRAPGKPQRDRFSGQQSGWDFYLSRDELAYLMATSVRTADRCFVSLHRLGHLEMVARGGRRGPRTVASVWRLAIPQHATSGNLGTHTNPTETNMREDLQHDTSGALGTATEDPQHDTSGVLGTLPNTPNVKFPTRQMGASQHDTSGVPREHRLQESAVLQESTADAQLLTQSLVFDQVQTSAQITRPTQARNPTTERARINGSAR